MSLGIVLHACLFQVPLVVWPVQGEMALTVPPAQNPYVYAVALIHGFRMPLFFLLSGFFSAMLLHRRGIKGLLVHRWKRIGLPLLVFSLTIVPITNKMFVPNEFNSLLGWLILVLFGGFAHLWFLWNLLLIALGYLLAVALGVRFRHGLWWLLLPLALVPQWLMTGQEFGADDPSTGIVPNFNLLFFYAVFFLCGVLFYERGLEIRRRWLAAMPAALVVFPVALLFNDTSPADMGMNRWLHQLMSSILQLTFCWLMCVGLMGLFRWIFHRERPWIRYLADASYWLYVAHLPLIILGQFLVVDRIANVHLQMLLLCAGVTAILLVAYATCIRYTIVGTMLNGPRTRTKKTASASV